MSARVKDLLAAAAGPDSQGDQGWHAAGIRRLYFQHARDIDAAGMVDVNDKEGVEPTHVRVELWVSPEIAAEVIAHITGREDLTIRVLVRDEIRRREAERANEEAETDQVHGDGLDVPASALRLEAEDDARNAELTSEIKATGGLAFGTEEDEVAAAAAIAAAEISRLAAEQKADDVDQITDVAEVA